MLTTLSKKDAKNQLNRILRVCQNRVGYKLFTLMKYDAENNRACRSYSSDPQHYPEGGYKPIPKNTWSELVIKNKNNFIANNIEEIKTVFYDYQLIESLGLGSALNVLIMSEGKVVGIVNLLDKKNSYTNKSGSNISRLSPWFVNLFKHL